MYNDVFSVQLLPAGINNMCNCSVVDKHREELAKKPNKINHHWIKDFLAEYAESFPQISIVLEANIDCCIYGQKGFENHTFKEMWELYSQHSAQKDRPHDFSSSQRDLIKKAHSSVCKWLHTPVRHITSVQMKRFRKYIHYKDDQVSGLQCNFFIFFYKNQNKKKYICDFFLSLCKTRLI